MTKASVSALRDAILALTVGPGTEMASADASPEKRDAALRLLAEATPDDLAEAIKGFAERDDALAVATALIACPTR